MATGLGIDIGSQWIKVVQVRCSGAQVTVTGAMRIPRPGGGLDSGEENEGATVVPPNLGQELAKARLRRTGTVGITGRDVNLRYITTPPIPPDKLRMYVDMQLGDKMAGAGKKGSEPPAVTYDYRILNIPTGLSGDLVVMAGVAKNEFLFGTFAALKEAKVDATRTTPSAFGLVHAYLRTQQIPENETVVLVDVGHEHMEIAILQDRSLYFARSAPGGGKKFDQALDKLLNLGGDRIQEYKHHRAKLHPDGTKMSSPQELQFQKALKEAADGIANGIRSAVMFCRTSAKLKNLDYQRIYLSGGGARLAGLRDYLESKTKRPVHVLDLYTGLDLRKLDAESARCFEGEIPDMTVALGLAVIDADPTCIHFELLPEAVAKRRNFLNKTVFAAAAGVVLMAGLYMPYQNAQASLSEAAAANTRFEDEVQKAKQVRGQFEAQRQKNIELAKRHVYYAKQARLGPVYLELFSQIRKAAPQGMRFRWMGPRDQSADARTTGSLSADYFTQPLRTVRVRGYYDTAEIDGPEFNARTDRFFRRLKEVAGVESIALDLAFKDTEMGLQPGYKGFQFDIRLAGPEAPLSEPEGPAPAGAGAPALLPVKQGADPDAAKTKPATKSEGDR
ncbi:MAG: pilus assembly protein PilM [Planctomycetes bacterium]|nr:pilus assembly protein PilM [Planctomycetota bacterium]